MKRVLLWLFALSTLALFQSACMEENGDGVPIAYPAKEQLPTVSALPTITLAPRTLIPTRDPGNFIEPDVSLNLVVPENALVNVQYPAFVEAEIVGRGVASIARIAGQRDADGRQRLLEIETLAPIEANDEGAGDWPEGVHELPLVWTVEADALNDSVNQEYVVLMPYGENNEQLAGDGSYQQVGKEIQDGVRLLIEPGAGSASLLQDVASGMTFVPRPGDEFRPDVLYLGDGGQLVSEPGKALVFDEAGQIGYERQLLPAGGYFLGISTAILNGETMTEAVDFIIQDVPLLPGYRAYLDPSYGFQFLYPAEWPVPALNDGRLTSIQPAGTMELNITRLPGAGGRGVAQLKREVIQSFGSIQVLFEDLIAVDGDGALWTAYGYDSVDGSHTGVFVILVDGETGYVIDVDGRAENEAQVLELVKVLADSWTFRPAGSENRLGSWVQESAGDLEVAVPADFDTMTLENGWYRFSAQDKNAFVAIRMEAGSDGELGQRHQYWLNAAGAGSDDFARNDPYVVEWADKRWLRSDFSNTNLLGNVVMGSLVGKFVDGQTIFIWSEARANEFEALDKEVFDNVSADVRPLIAPDS
jgi:hypothetical protein